MKTNVHVLVISRWILLRMRNVSDKTCRGNQNTHFIFSNVLSQFVPFFGIMWKNIVKPGRPQITIWRMSIAFWIPKATVTHSDVLIFRYNNGCTNTPQCYVIFTLPVLLQKKKVSFNSHNSYLRMDTQRCAGSRIVHLHVSWYSLHIWVLNISIEVARSVLDARSAVYGQWFSRLPAATSSAPPTPVTLPFVTGVLSQRTVPWILCSKRHKHQTDACHFAASRSRLE